LSEHKLDKSPGLDNIHPWVLFELRNENCKPLKTLFDLSLQTGKTPTDWRSAVITALHKKENNAYVSNYRPVSLTCYLQGYGNSCQRSYHEFLSTKQIIQ